MRHIESAKDLGNFVRQARQRAKLSQTDLAESVGTTRQWLSRFEQGSNDVSLATVFAILQELDVTWHLDDDTEPEAPAPSPETPQAAPKETLKSQHSAGDRSSLFRSRTDLSGLSAFTKTGNSNTTEALGTGKRSSATAGSPDATQSTSSAISSPSPASAPKPGAQESEQTTHTPASSSRYTIEADIARISQSTLFKKHRKN